MSVMTQRQGRLCGAEPRWRIAEPTDVVVLILDKGVVIDVFVRLPRRDRDLDDRRPGDAFANPLDLIRLEEVIGPVTWSPDAVGPSFWGVADGARQAPAAGRGAARVVTVGEERGAS